MVSTDGTPTPRRWLLIAAVAAAAVAVTYWCAVRTVTGQRIENAALRGADQVPRAAGVAASDELSSISLVSFAVACAVLVLAGWWRGGTRVAVGVAAVLAGSTAITETLKLVLARPELVPVTGDYTDNSFPSGHTTIAMSALFAFLLVVPHRWRGAAVFLGATYAVGIGAQTVTAKWHRVSDTVGADLVALAVACLVLAWLARAGALRPVPRRRRLRVWTVGLPLGALTTLALVTGTVILLRSQVPATADPVLDRNAFLASLSLALAGSGVAALTLWVSLRQVQVAPRHAAEADARGASVGPIPR